MKKYEYILKGLDCASCANKIQNKLSENPNYKNVVVNFNTLKLSFQSDLENVKSDIIETIAKLEPEVEVLDINSKNQTQNETKNYNLYRVIIGIIIMIFAIYVKLPGNINFILTIFAYIVLLFRTTKNAIKLLMKKTIDENFLVTVSCIGAFFIGEQAEGLMVIVLYEIGKLLEEKAVNNTRKSISDLMNIKPEYANLVKDNKEQKVSPEEVKIGDIIIIKQGEKIPIDGMVIDGEAFINNSALTGESKLQEVKENDFVLSGSINEKGLLHVKTTKKYEDSTVNKILELVENATDKKAKTETFVNRVSKIYTPIVIFLAILVAVFLPIISNVTYIESIYRALIFLVISCPCAIVISVPLSYFSGIGKASKNGVLIKGSNYLDNLKDVNTIVFDKTGTLTKGKFEVEKIKVYDNNYTEEQILEYAVIGEVNSNHPISTAIVNKYNKKIEKNNAKDFKEISGKGLTYVIDDKTIKIGNHEFVGIKEDGEIGTVVYVSLNDKVLGAIVLNDIVKPEAKEAIESLNKMKIKTMMFTGDNNDIAQKIGMEIGINEIKANMLPTDKYEKMEDLIKNNQKGKTAFVGDGINDSPVLAISDVGISMGGIGASSAIEASDIVIMTDNLNKIKDAILISKKTNKIIKQNLIFALLVKILVLILSVLGLSQMWMAVFADVGVTLITIFNLMIKM